jgi:Ni/Fe-hydrogenase subunit HybB-like protein
MTKASLSYFVLVRGLLQFGILAAVVYVLLNVLMNGSSLSTVKWGIVIGFPVFGLLWGLLIWWYEQKRKSKGA